MPNKKFILDGDVPVTIYKRRGNRNLRLSVAVSGEARVSIPAWAPYKAGLDFARARYDWILAQRRLSTALVEGQPVGKAHHLFFKPKPGASKPASRVVSSGVIVSYPPALTPADPVVQRIAQSACVRALRSQAEQLLPQRLAALAKKHDFSYSSVNIKQLKSRWGSCDHNQAITLNLFLMQLPWKYIDYVLLHELVHTKVLRHGPDFWKMMTALQPDAKALRKELREYRPDLDSPTSGDVT